jgi:hypothetical protein
MYAVADRSILMEEPWVLSMSRGVGAEAWARPAHRADVAQARMFDGLLVSEIAVLPGLVAAIERRWLRRCEDGADDRNRPPQSLVPMRRGSGCSPGERSRGGQADLLPRIQTDGVPAR